MKYREIIGRLGGPVLLLALTCVLLFAPDAYLLMLARAFMLWWAVLSAMLMLVAVGRKRWWWVAASAVSMMMLILQVSAPVLEPNGTSSAPGLRIAQMNVWQPNEDRARAIAAAVSTGADLISVQEVSPEWAEELRRTLAKAYPFQHIDARTNCYGIALFSKRPFNSVRTITMAGAPFIEARMAVDGMPVRMFVVHATSPGSYAHFRRRNKQLIELAERIREEDLPTLVIGDLNTVHWDGAYQRFCARSGVRPINSPFTTTWPALGPLALIPLDHALVAGGLLPVTVDRFLVSGSDHRGLITELRLDHAR